MPEAIVVMGVSGAGKTTIGKRLARALHFDFADADRYHPQANIDKMAAGEPLTDADRWPWLGALRALIEERASQGRSLVLGCSALKRSYRAVLAGARPAGGTGEDAGRGGGAARPASTTAPGPAAPRVTFVYLRGDYDTILARMKRRTRHYMKADMLASQFRDLEEPQGAVTVDVTRSVAGSVRQALDGLARRGVRPAPRTDEGNGGAGKETEEGSP